MSLSNLTRTLAFCVHELAKIIMIGKHKHFGLVNFEIMPPSFESFNNNQKFTDMSFVSSFDKNHFIRIIDYWVPLAQVI